jgi:hypothetical protein
MGTTRVFSHKDVDRRIFRLVEVCVVAIDKNPELLAESRIQVGRYSSASLRHEWERFLDLPWSELRAIVLETSAEGDRIRQSVPFGGFLSDEERMEIIEAQ